MKYLFRLLAVLVLAMALFTPTASADTVLFTFETIQLQQALADAIAGEGWNPNAYAFFDVTMTPVSRRENGIVDLMPAYTISEATSPSPFETGVNEWTATPGVYGAGVGYVAFALNFADAYYPLVSTNELGKTFTATTTPAEFANKFLTQMEESRTWSIGLESAELMHPESVTFLVTATGIKLNTASTKILSKDVGFTTSLELTPEAVPEASTFLVTGGGLAMLLFAFRRRRQRA